MIRQPQTIIYHYVEIPKLRFLLNSLFGSDAIISHRLLDDKKMYVFLNEIQKVPYFKKNCG